MQRQRRIAGQTRLPELARLNFIPVRLRQREHVGIEAAQLLGDPIPTGELASADIPKHNLQRIRRRLLRGRPAEVPEQPHANTEDKTVQAVDSFRLSILIS